MVDVATFKKWALALPDAVEAPHFEKASFRVNKKIFATLDLKNNRAMLKLPLAEQSVFCTYDKNVFFPVPGFWGKQGATFVDLEKVRKDMFKDALKTAYEGIILAKKPKKK
jgi:predicted DNA-binding protein (MmcQ/YjbR family)